ncbi:unnamed protein product [Linum tenue]|uniref:TIP41-like protein n=1 Tax=Linum tenue TaxID=586396 RepID=A0AAV0PNT5_9ROSI|nr:unnamed protein product [Linum tenue]
MTEEVDANGLKAAGAELLTDGRHGLRIHGWEIVSKRGSILSSSSHEQWEEKLQTSHLPEMVFGDSCLVLKHLKSGTKLHFNAFDALMGWKQEALPPVEVPAAAQWKFRSKPFQQVILDYDYTFTTPYVGSEMMEDQNENGKVIDVSDKLHWEDCKEHIDVGALASKEPILFYDELRVDGVLMRLRDTRIYCAFSDGANPVILRESCWRQVTFQALSAKGYPIDDSAYSDPNIISQRLPVIMHRTQKLKGPW